MAKAVKTANQKAKDLFDHANREAREREAALAAGHEARLATDRPTAHFGASLRCQVRLSAEEIVTPVIPAGEAHVLLALERLEALRWVHEVQAGGLVVVAGRTVPTPRMRLGLEVPPPDLPARLRVQVARTIEVPAAELEREPRSPDAAGGVLLGLVSPLLPIADLVWEQALRGLFAGAELAAWRMALEHGRQLFARLPDALRLAPTPRAA